MTGGSQRAKEINQQLGIIAKETGLLVATGSVSAALKDASLADTYQIMRKETQMDSFCQYWCRLGCGRSKASA